MSDNSDFNDVAAIESLAVVKNALLGEVEKLKNKKQLPASGEVDAPHPIISEDERLNQLVRQYALMMPEGKIWDVFACQLIKKTAFKDMVTSEMFKKWLNHVERRTVDKAVMMAKPPETQGSGLGMALARYVYINPSDFVWDLRERETTPLAHLKFAIASCWSDWLIHPSRLEVDKKNFVFDPRQKIPVSGCINTFRGLQVKPEFDDTKCAGILAAIVKLCNNDAVVFKWLIRWMAYPLQNVGAKMDTAILIHSTIHGSGKSLIFDVLMRQIYGEYAKTVGQSELESSYNEWISQTLWACYEEVLSRGQKYSHTGTIKQVITGQNVRIQKKFMSGWEESNYMNCVFLSNEIVPIPIEPSDRRFLVVWPKSLLGDELQERIDFELKNGGAAAFMGYLLGVNMDDNGKRFNPHTKPPVTEAKRRLIDHGKPAWEIFYEEWRDGELTHNDNLVPFCACTIADLFYIYEKWCSKNKEGLLGKNKFCSFITSMPGLRKKHHLWYKTANENKQSSFIIPPKVENKEGTDGDGDGDGDGDYFGGCVGEFKRIIGVFNGPDV